MYPYYQSYDYSFFYDQPCVRNNKKYVKNCPNSIVDVLQNMNHNYKYLITLSGMEDLYNQSEGKYTVFVPKNLDAEFVKNLDRYYAQSILNYNTAPTIIDERLLNNYSNFYQINTRENSLTIDLRKNSEGLFANDIRIVGMKRCCNGIIYFTEKIVLPPVYYK